MRGLRSWLAARSRRGRARVFCIGRNKTGTSSMAAALAEIGYRVAPQAAGEALIDDWATRDFRRIVALARRYEAFQDVPFNLDFTYQALDAHFPGSRFVLTVRSSSAEWYSSLVRYHAKLMGTGVPPPVAAMRAFGYREPGYLFRAHCLVYGVDETTLYDRETYVRHYEAHNASVRSYFRHRPDDLLVLNLADSDSSRRLCRFLGLSDDGVRIPHLNRSDA